MFQTPLQVRLARSTRARRGSILIEFALVALAFYLLLSGTIELGRAITTSQVLQNAARAGARELALIQLPATTTFEEALEDPRVRASVYDPALLAIEVTDGAPEPIPDTWPVINRMLYPLMVREDLTTTGPDGEPVASRFLHYPGAIVRDTVTGAFTVAVPHVTERDAAGHETIRWLPVVEEVRSNPGDPDSGPFSVASTSTQRLLVALRIHCPYQAATMIATRPGPGAPPGTSMNPVLADDGAVTEENEAPGTLVGGDGIGIYAGSYGLGKFYAMGLEVRPYRRLISAQSIFRREVFD